MDTERTLQFVVETQARFAADLGKLRALALQIGALTRQMASAQQEQARRHNELLSVVHEMARMQRQDRERFEAFLKRMDAWVRRGRNGGKRNRNG